MWKYGSLAMRAHHTRVRQVTPNTQQCIEDQICIAQQDVILCAHGHIFLITTLGFVAGTGAHDYTCLVAPDGFVTGTSIHDCTCLVAPFGFVAGPQEGSGRGGRRGRAVLSSLWQQGVLGL